MFLRSTSCADVRSKLIVIHQEVHGVHFLSPSAAASVRLLLFAQAVGAVMRPPGDLEPLMLFMLLNTPMMITVDGKAVVICAQAKTIVSGLAR